MKNQETFNVVMLPTEKASLLGLTNGKLYYSEFGHMTDIWEGQHLYILSDEKIKEGDWVLHNSGYISQVLGFNIDAIKLLDAQRWTKDCKKIVASTDKEITPETWIHDSFVNVFLLSYNNKKQITEIKLDIVPYDGTTPISENWNGQIKTRKDGSVIIHQNKTYSQAEVDDLLDRQASITTDQVLKNQAKMYSADEVKTIANAAWHNGYWNHYEEINGQGSSHENPLSSMNFIKQNVNKI